MAEEVKEWVEQSPYSTAIIDEDFFITREQLWAWCDQLARRIGSLESTGSLNQSNICALIMPRSWAIPMSLIASRCASTIFMILDRNQASERTLGILSRVCPAYIIHFKDSSTINLLGKLEQQCLASIDVDPPLQGLETLTLHYLSDARKLSSDIGHLCFTSGSSGTPKGVLLEDSSLLRTAAEQRKLLGLTGRQEMQPQLWALNPSFDASLSDIFCALLGPAPLAVFRKEQTNWKSLSKFVKQYNIEGGDLAPSLLRILKPKNFGFKRLIFGGERCEAATAKQWGESCLALQAYGPTEAAVCAAMAVAGNDWIPGLLGRPLFHQNLAIHTQNGLFKVLASEPSAQPKDGKLFNQTILQDWNTSEPMLDLTVEGELWIIGSSVALGYLDDLGMQERKFGFYENSRVHYTGDLVEWKNGSLIWKGRKDRQIKRNGKMVCPEEIELFVEKEYRANNMCVLDGNSLILFVQASDSIMDEQEVRTSIIQKVGLTLRPDLVVFLKEWPLDSRGKTTVKVVLDQARREGKYHG